MFRKTRKEENNCLGDNDNGEIFHREALNFRF